MTLATCTDPTWVLIWQNIITTLLVVVGGVLLSKILGRRP